MLAEEMRAAVRQQIMRFADVDPMLHVQARTLELMLDQSLVRIIARDLVPYATQYELDTIGDIFEIHVAHTGDRNRIQGGIRNGYCSDNIRHPRFLLH